MALKDKDHPDTGCSPCSHLTRDTEVSAAIPPDNRAAPFTPQLLNTSLSKIDVAGLKNSIVISFLTLEIYKIIINVPCNL